MFDIILDILFPATPAAFADVRILLEPQSLVR